MMNNLTITIRQETGKDFPQVFALIEQAFRNEVHSDHREQFLVERLRRSEAFVPELSIVAESGKGIAGYCLLTRIGIKNEAGASGSLALAPVAVKPEFQKQGIGTSVATKKLRIIWRPRSEPSSRSLSDIRNFGCNCRFLPAPLHCSAYRPSGLLASHRFGSAQNRSGQVLRNFFVATLS